MDVFNYLDKVRYKISNRKDNRENPQRLKTYCFVPDGHPFPSFISPEGNKVDINKGYKRFMKSGEYESHPSFVVSKNIYFDRKGQQIYFEPGIMYNTPELICHCTLKLLKIKSLKNSMERICMIMRMVYW